ncbi:flagellar motor protein MotB [Desulfobulbus rhabdoformis]|uniref:OmpA/MotB family protein n=1 Tax=Desulfobulbus rhabdoformis TaxID=34032 RepID=UPI00196389EC|nr:flagellar motor protein MotB [Desulfobulbus rhabdoformis]MBM9612767.1 flagellar motor protein MotB [Desulfobulbus rhabdoformis]
MNNRSTWPASTKPATSSSPEQQTQSVFTVEDSFSRSRTPARPLHWSIAWSDLMMTMFILFLTLFVHLKSQENATAYGVPNRIADENIPVQVSDIENSLVFHPISQDVSMKISKNAQEILAPPQEQSGSDILVRHQTAQVPPPMVEPAQLEPPASPPPTPTLPVEEPQIQPAKEVITKIYDLSNLALADEKLQRLATVELIPDKTMRIILTGDLLFATGEDELSENALASLKILSQIINKSPYMINVIGHTDDQPVKTARFPSNWELSLARASQVARFLIDSTDLPPTQFRVTGYSLYRPLVPNTSESNRARNRRVEIVLSKELPSVAANTLETVAGVSQ